MFSRKRITAALIALIVLVVGGWLINDVVADPARSGAFSDVPGADSGLAVVELSTLPPEADKTWRLIESGGPYPHPSKDDTVFGNREGILPERDLGYYREYTVPTPGLSHRGGRRLVTGSADELYYTGDHYESFVVVDPDR